MIAAVGYLPGRGYQVLVEHQQTNQSTEKSHVLTTVGILVSTLKTRRSNRARRYSFPSINHSINQGSEKEKDKD
jgi:hypothetical protein